MGVVHILSGVPPLTIARMAMEHEIMPETSVTGIVNHYKIKALTCQN